MRHYLPISFYALLLCGLVIANVSIYHARSAPRELSVRVLEAGDGRVTLIHSPDGSTYLVDAGPDAGVLRVLDDALPLWQRDLDAIILTSDKKEHTGGLEDIRGRYTVKNTVTFGSGFMLGNTNFNIRAPGSFTVSYGAASFTVSSSTLAGTYIPAATAP